MRRFVAVPFLAVALSAQAQPEMVVSVGHAGAPSHAAFAGDHLATASSWNVALIDLSTGLTIAPLPQADLVDAIGTTRAGDLIAVGTCGHSLELWDVKARTPLRRIAPKQECAESVSFSPDGGLLATGAYGCCSGGGLQIWDVRSGELTRELAKPSGIRSVAFSRDGRWLVGVDDAEDGVARRRGSDAVTLLVGDSSRRPDARGNIRVTDRPFGTSPQGSFAT